MIVEAFLKGSNFKKVYDTFWHVKSIIRNGNNFCLLTEYNQVIAVLSTDEYELRITY